MPSKSKTPKVKTLKVKTPARPSNDLLERYKALSKGRHEELVPMVDKNGQWSWRGKDLERVWEAIATCEPDDLVRHADLANGPPGSFTERYEATLGDLRVFGGTCSRGGGGGGDDDDDDAAMDSILPEAFLAVILPHLLTSLQLSMSDRGTE